MTPNRKRGRPPKGIEREIEDLIAYDRRVPNEPGLALVEGVTIEAAREAESETLKSRPLRDQSAYRAYRDFITEHGFEPSKAKLKSFILQNRSIYPDAPAPDDLKGWTRVFRNSGLGFLSPPLVDGEEEGF